MISIVIPNYNSGDRLLKNIPKLIDLLSKTKHEYEIIVTDDASTDNSQEILQKLDIKIVTSPKNTGFGTNVGRGIRAAKGEIIFILNAIDILPEKPDYFSLMLSHFKDRKVFSVAAGLMDKNVLRGCGQIYFHRGFFLHRYQNPESKTSSWADGGAEAIRKEYYLKIGGFDSLYKFYWEDVDLGYRAWKAGYRIDFEPKAVLIHERQAGPISRFYSEHQKRIMNFRNQFIFTWKNGDLSHLIQYGIWEIYHSAIAMKNGDRDFFRAYWQAFSRWPQIFFARLRQKRVTKLSDNQCLSLLS